MNAHTRHCWSWAVLVTGAVLAYASAGVEAQPSTPDILPLTQADREAAFPDFGDMRVSDMMLEDPFNRLVLLDQLEARDADGRQVLSWDLHAWVGRNLNRLWIRSEGEKQSGTTDRAELQLLWGHTIARWWDVVAGVRQDFRPGPSQSWGAFGIQGLAPYRFELEATAFVGEGGQAAARFEAEYELLITNRLILQPLIELNWYGQDDSPRGIGAGFASAESGLRLRYEFRREIAPYIGLVRERKFRGTADLGRAAGIDTRDTRLVAGIRLWF
ncbi:MAG TPA: copper resistance protein B [Gammaproteobacteria bacterium]|nr:copper resistance protein B [Gammaproteobacteria bacterium]